MTTAAAEPRRPIRSLRRRVGATFLATLVLLIVLLAVVFLALFDLERKGDEVADRWQPAFTVSQNLLSDVVNQETGVRGYALSGQESLLAPYATYRVAQQRHERTLRGYLAGHRDLLADVDALASAAGLWRTSFAEPFIQRVKTGDRSVAVDAAGPRAKSAFDRIRTVSAKLTADVGVARRSAAHEQARAKTFLLTALLVTTALVLIVGILLWRGLRRAVLEPIESLAAQTRTVAAGNVGRRILASGPPELEALGDDVDAMRARIAEELDRVERARAELLARTEDLARSNADLEQFAYVASHDLTEPLRKVANFCQLLERQYGDQLDDKAKQYIAYAVDGARRMQILITDLLSFSRVGRSTEKFTDVNLNAAVDRAVANLDHSITEARAEIVRPDLPTVRGDAPLLTALFQNLIGNSVKYRSEDPPQVQISATRGRDHWLVTISDNGIGIDPKYGERIFAIFQRLHLRDQYGGTGIGLAMCRKIVEFHGGRIWLAEQASRGATFRFTLAAEPGSPAPAAQETPRNPVVRRSDAVGTVEP
jgi:signal transduction histidine kinase